MNEVRCLRSAYYDVIDADGFAVCPDDAGRGQHRVLLRKRLPASD